MAQSCCVVEPSFNVLNSLELLLSPATFEQSYVGDESFNVLNSLVVLLNHPTIYWIFLCYC